MIILVKVYINYLTHELVVSLLKSIVKQIIQNFQIISGFNEECKYMKREVNNHANSHDISKPPFSEIYHKLELEYNRIN